MLKTYSANYTESLRDTWGQLIEWPEVITEGRTWKTTDSFFRMHSRK